MEPSIKKELIINLRAITGAGMADCVKALEESDFDIEKAVDIIKTKGKNIVSGREGKEATEGIIYILDWDEFEAKYGFRQLPPSGYEIVAVEVNCQTDFAAKSKEFSDFAKYTCQSIGLSHWCYGDSWDPLNPNKNGAHVSNEIKRQELISKIKENVVVRRWWIEEGTNGKIFTYTHSNNKLGSIVTIQAPNEEVYKSKDFNEIGLEIAMQVAAMNPLSVSKDLLSKDVTDRQTKIFEEQLRVANKPQTQWSRILEGKLNKWYSEVCLLNQESVVYPKKSIEQVIATEYKNKLNGEIKIISFSRCVVGEGLESAKKVDFSSEVNKLAESVF